MQLLNHPQHSRREPCFLLSLLPPEYFLPRPFFLHFSKLFGRVLQSEMRISVHRHANLTVPHQILERLRVHAGLRHVAAISVAANMRGDAWELKPENLVVSVYHMLEAVLPVHRH